MKKSRTSAIRWKPAAAMGLMTALVVHGSGLVRAQNPTGLIYSNQWLALGPFSLPGDFDCNAGDAALLKDYLAPSSIELLAPKDGDEIEYDTAVAATTAYNGPTGPGGKPMWRPFDDGVDGIFTPDEDLDMNQDAINVGSPADYVTTFVVTYFEYLGVEPTEFEMCVGSDDSVQVWIDTHLVHNHNDCRGRGMCQDNVPVTIPPGLHRIAMAVFERDGSFGGSLGFKDSDGNFITDASPDWTFLGTDPGGLAFPTARFSVDVSSGFEPLTVQFDGSASTSPGGSITKYVWQFGDGETAEGARVSHIYRKGSFYEARLYVTNNVKGTDATAQTINVTMSTEIVNWISADIGNPALPGAARQEGACIRVFAGGRAISETSDQFQFTYLEKTGDVVLTAQVEEALWKPGAVAGIMLRESLAPDSRFAFMNIQFFPGVAGIQYGLLTRKTPGVRALASRGKTELFGDHGYLRLERKGNEFISSTSPDGTTWTLLYSTIFSTMSPSLLAGLAVAAGDTETSRQSARINFCHLDFGATAAVFHRGDSDGNGQLQLTDAVRILNFLFLGTGHIDCLDAADADNNGSVQLTDAVRILNVLFLGLGSIPDPGAPGETFGNKPCGPDPGADADHIGCTTYNSCGG